MKNSISRRNSLKWIAIIALSATKTLVGVEPAQTTNGAFSEDYFVAKIGPVINFFAPVENMVTPEDYFSLIGVTAEKTDDTTYRISKGERRNLAQAFYLLQDPGIYTINPPIESLELQRLFHPEIVGPPYQLKRTWNFSVRSEVRSGEKVSVGGLVVPGKHAKTVIIRALGPSLANYGLVDTLDDPKIEVIRSTIGFNTDPAANTTPTVKILENDDHQSNYVATETLLSWTGIATPTHENEALIATVLDPGIYSVALSAASDDTGVGLLEFYIFDEVDVVNSPSNQ